MAKKQNRRPKRDWDKDEKFEKDSCTSSSNKKKRSFDKSARNDPAWYKVNNTLYEQSGSFSYGWPLGNKVDLSTAGATDPNPRALSGLATIYFAPSIGVSTNKASPINMAAVNLYSDVRHANSGHANYDPADLMMYLLALDSAYMYHSMLRRAYGMLRNYSPVNRYYPRAFIEAMGLDFDDLILHMSDFVYYINNYAVKLGSLAAPASFTYFKRHMWMCDNIYVDDPTSAKAQTYMLCPTGFWKWTNTGSTGTKLEFVDFYHGRAKTLSDLINFGTTLLEFLLGDEDVGIISGDIIKAYGVTNLMQMYDTPFNYAVLPSYDANVLNQIHNATLCGEVDPTSWDITQDPSINEGAILFNPRTRLWNDTEGGTSYLLKRIISQKTDSVTADDNYEATRFANVGKSVQRDQENLASYLTFEHTGTEITLWAVITTFETVNGDWKLVRRTVPGIIRAYDGDTYALFSDSVKLLARMSVFNDFPCVFIEANGLPDHTIFEINNFTVMDEHDLAKMHETALISMFQVAQVARQAVK